MSKQTYDLFSWKCLQAVVRCGSLKEAAKALEMEPSSVTRRIKHLSKELGFPLVEIHGRNLCPTEKGKAALRSFLPILKSSENILTNLHEGRDQEITSFHIVSPIGYAIHVLSRAVNRFRERHPKSRFWIESGLYGTENFENLGHGIDVIISTIPRENSSFIKKEISTHDSLCFASKVFVDKHRINSPRDLLGLPLAGNSQFIIKQYFEHITTKEKIPMPIDFCLESDNTHLLMEWAAQGNGILLGSPYTAAAPYVRRGELVEVLSDWHLPKNHVYAFASARDYQQEASLLPEFFEELSHASDQAAKEADEIYTKIEEMNRLALIR